MSEIAEPVDVNAAGAEWLVWLDVFLDPDFFWEDLEPEAVAVVAVACVEAPDDATDALAAERGVEVAVGAGAVAGVGDCSTA